MKLKPLLVRSFFVLAACNAASAASAQDAASASDKPFSLTINGNRVGVAPGETVTVKMPDGTDLIVKLDRNPEVTFSGDGFSFRHSSEFQVSTSVPANDISQHLIVTGLGTLVLVQAYKGMDPTLLVEFMLRQVTGDDVKAGAKLESRPHQRTISGGMTISGLKGTTVSSDESAQTEVMAAKTAYGGIIAVTRIDSDNENSDRAFVEKFWSSLKPQ